MGPLGAGFADAGTLFSAAINPASSGQIVRCSVVNVGKKTATVTFSIIMSSNGSTIAGPTERTIDPGEGGDIAVATSEFTYCKVEGINKKNFRGHVTLETDLGGNDFVAEVSVPLQ